MQIINEFVNSILDIIRSSGFMSNDWRNYIMIGIACILIYLAIKKEFEPLLLLPIAFGMMMVNLYPAIMAEPTATANGGLFYYLYQGVKLGIYPPLIFLGIGAMTDFGPLIANPKSFLLGAPPGFEAGKDFVPDHRHHPDFPPAARCGNAGWHADAGQFDAREWRCFPYC